ncbi:hypothetical protein [Agromyces sp. NPDC057865]|uniref:hypothetical protein n=1 Tax=Agromyces sp. NPDC057865 TaxID=3346267 RepID=UPI0036717CD3
MNQSTKLAQDALEALQRLLRGIDEGESWCSQAQLRALISARVALEQLADWEI